MLRTHSIQEINLLGRYLYNNSNHQPGQKQGIKKTLVERARRLRELRNLATETNHINSYQLHLMIIKLSLNAISRNISLYLEAIEIHNYKDNFGTEETLKINQT